MKLLDILLELDTSDKKKTKKEKKKESDKKNYAKQTDEKTALNNLVQGTTFEGVNLEAEEAAVWVVIGSDINLKELGGIKQLKLNYTYDKPDSYVELSPRVGKKLKMYQASQESAVEAISALWKNMTTKGGENWITDNDINLKDKAAFIAASEDKAFDVIEKFHSGYKIDKVIKENARAERMAAALAARERQANMTPAERKAADAAEIKDAVKDIKPKNKAETPQTIKAAIKASKSNWELCSKPIYVIERKSSTHNILRINDVPLYKEAIKDWKEHVAAGAKARKEFRDDSDRDVGDNTSKRQHATNVKATKKDQKVEESFQLRDLIK